MNYIIDNVCAAETQKKSVLEDVRVFPGKEEDLDFCVPKSFNIPNLPLLTKKVRTTHRTLTSSKLCHYKLHLDNSVHFCTVRTNLTVNPFLDDLPTDTRTFYESSESDSNSESDS